MSLRYLPVQNADIPIVLVFLCLFWVSERQIDTGRKLDLPCLPTVTAHHGNSQIPYAYPNFNWPNCPIALRSARML